RARARGGDVVRPAPARRHRRARAGAGRLRRPAMSAARVVVSPHNVVSFPEGGGHLWAYLQHVQGLRAIGCDVWWMECLAPKRDVSRDHERIALLRDRLAVYGMGDRTLFY